MGQHENSNLISKNCALKTIMALKPNQLQFTTIHAQASAIIASTQSYLLLMTCSDHLTLKNESKRESLEIQQDNPFDYFLQSTTWLPRY
jgi:hypothetical protein